MAKVNLYISNDAYEKINAIIEKRRQEGAREKSHRRPGKFWWRWR